ncbi:hypothetical protein OS493_024171 [Desmophyllum pertusum]|uniref:Uncharacterized protein n=1 Tax=Desmophyllum pertusum TaxID=174260 RepID=A0A9X0CW53_9CNID|nr:hypothetical protein OS493_024171 [Desmophyllum pertusum]
MEFGQKNMNLSFSIENILRDDFPQRQRSLPLTPCYERWPNSAVYGQYYAVHYSPVIMKCLPDMPHRVEERLQRVNGPEEQISEECQHDLRRRLLELQRRICSP